MKEVAASLANGGRVLAIFEGIRAQGALEGRRLTIFRRPPFCHNPFSTLFEPLSRLGSPCLPLFLCPQAWSLSSGHMCDHSPPITMRELKTKTAQHTHNDWPPKVFSPYLALFTLSRLLTPPLVGRRWFLGVYAGSRRSAEQSYRVKWDDGTSMKVPEVPSLCCVSCAVAFWLETRNLRLEA